MTDARTFLEGLVGRPLETLTGRPNCILRLEGDDAIVQTGKSPSGQAVPIAWVQDALDMLESNGEVQIDVETVGYRSAFIGAVLSEFPSAIGTTNPRTIRLATPPA